MTTLPFKHDNPSVVVADGILHINNFLETDPIVVRCVEANNDSVAEVHRLLVLGGHVSTVTGAASAAITLTEAVDRLTNNVEETVDGAVEGITTATKGLLDGQDGQLPKAFTAFMKQFEAMLDTSFDPTSKKSILAKFERLLEAAAKDQTKLLNAPSTLMLPTALLAGCSWRS